MSRLIDITDYEVVFLGANRGIGLKRRGPTDNHVLVQMLAEDDDNWFASDEPFSPAWLPDLANVLADMQSWLDMNCVKVQWGYAFKI